MYIIVLIYILSNFSNYLKTMILIVLTEVSNDSCYAKK